MDISIVATIAFTVIPTIALVVILLVAPKSAPKQKQDEHSS